MGSPGKAFTMKKDSVIAKKIVRKAMINLLLSHLSIGKYALRPGGKYGFTK